MSVTSASLAAASATIASAAAHPTPTNQTLALYGMIPSHSANLAGLILWAILWFFQTVLGLWFRQWWFLIALFVACGLETAGYVGRFMSSDSANSNLNDFLVQIICLTLGPAFIMGGVYYQLAKLVTIYGEKFSLLRPMHYSLTFVLCDLTSIVLQAIGGGMAAVAVQNDKETATGTHIMVAGIVFQVFSMAIFMILFAQFLIKIVKARRQTGNDDAAGFSPQYQYLRDNKFLVPFFGALWWCTICVFIRCVYRVVELAEGWKGFLIVHERYFLVLDGLFCFFGVLAVTILHPGVPFGKNVIAVQGLHSKRAIEEAREPKHESQTSDQDFESA